MKRLKIFEVALDTEDADVLGNDFITIADAYLKDKDNIYVLLIKTDLNHGSQKRMYEISQVFHKLGVDNLVILPVGSDEYVEFFKARRIQNDSDQ